jgi:hypothetical protein
VICHDKRGPAARDFRPGVAVQVDIDAQPLQRIGPETGIGPVLVDIIEIQLADFRLAAEPLD